MAYIRTKTVKGHDYHYIVESYRPGPGMTPRQRTVEYIGNDEALRRFTLALWRRRGAGPAGEATFRCYEHGSVAALWKAAGLVRIEEILGDALDPKVVKGMPRGRVLVLAIVHRACDPGSKRAFSDWAARTSLPYHLRFDAASLDSQAFWEAMDGVTEEQLDRCTREVVARLRELFPSDLSILHLDYTNYHTWIDTTNGRCVICRRGHSKQKRSDLRQSGLALLTAKTLTVPLVWELYPGNKNDSSELPDFAGKVAASPVLAGGGDDVTVTFDGGGNSEETLTNLPFHFVCGHSLVGLGHLLDIDVAEYREVDLGDGDVRLCHRVDDLEFSGVTGTGVLTISEDLRRGQVAALEKDEARLAAKADELRGRLGNPRSTLHGRLRRAEADARARRAEAEAYNEALEADRARGEGRGRRRRAVPPEFDEAAAMSAIVSAEAFKGLTRLKAFWSASASRGGDGRWEVTLSRDDGAREAHMRGSFGKKLTVTDRADWPTDRILGAYVDQECIENFFRTTKGTDHFSVRPQYHWTDDKIRVHVFLCLMSVVLAEVVRRHAADAGIEASKDTILDALSGVHDGWVSVDGRKAARAVQELDGFDARLWEAVMAMPGETLGAGKS